MTTTLTIVETFTTQTRKNGEISRAVVQVLLDGIPTNADFRAKAGETLVIIDGDTIIVSTEQVDSLRAAQVHAAKSLTEMRARAEAELAAEIAVIKDYMAAKGASDEACAEVVAHYHANPVVAADPNSAKRDAFDAQVDRILARHGIR